MKRFLRHFSFVVILCSACFPALAWDLDGTKSIALTTRDGQSLPIGTVSFTPKDDHTEFAIHLDYPKFKDYFLSMREFKCLDGQDEVQCQVPYPYKHANSITLTDLRWLEHSLLFFFKTPTEFGAKLWNGLYYKLSLTEAGLEGAALSVDLNQISSPPSDLSVPPYKADALVDIASGTRYFSGLTIR